MLSSLFSYLTTNINAMAAVYGPALFATISSVAGSCISSHKAKKTAEALRNAQKANAALANEVATLNTTVERMERNLHRRAHVKTVEEVVYGEDKNA